MSPLKRILEQAQKLSASERRKLVDKLQRSLVAKPKRKRVPKKPKGRSGLEHSLALAGTVHSAYTDVSSDKYKHLAEIYADNHDHE